MATKTYLISLETLKNDYPFDDNLEEKYIKPHIIKCQDFVICPLLGKEKYDEIILQINTNAVSDLNGELIKDYIQPIIAYYVMSEVVYTTAYKLKNQGTEDSNNQYKFDELVKLSKKYLIDSETYQSRLTEWMRLYTPLTISPLYEYKNSLYLGSTHRINYHNLPDKTI